LGFAWPPTSLILNIGIASTFHLESKEKEGRDAIRTVLADRDMGIGASTEENKNSCFMNHSAVWYEILKRKENCSLKKILFFIIACGLSVKLEDWATFLRRR
jgi:hypothetical protein